MSAKKRISVLGVTGSIGQSTADVIASAPERFEVDTLSAHDNYALLAETAQRLSAACVVIGNEAHESPLRDLLQGTGIAVLSGVDALAGCVCAGTDITVAAISGIAGLKPLIGAIKNSRAVAIANKEPLVAAGALVMAEADKYGTQILPIDSEHNAIFQVFDPQQRSAVQRIILTASGGPFLNWDMADIAKATPEQAIAHPNWEMGAKISVDSASMMNKALEIIEAHVLFDLPPSQIEVIIHPQSAVHSMVEYNDGSVLAQMGASDMRTPIAYALAWPDRMDTPGERLDFKKMSTLNFVEADFTRFPALRLAYECLDAGQAACLAFNTANEVAVAAFLKQKIGFLDIISTIEFALANKPVINLDSIESIEQADRAVREITEDYINSKAPCDQGPDLTQTKKTKAV